MSDPAAIAIRRAVPEDWPDLLRMGKAAHRESAYAALPFDESRALAAARRYFDRSERHGFWLALRHGRPAGFLAGVIEEYYFSEARLARDVVFYVDPEARGSAAARRLVQAFAAWAEALKVSEVQIGVTSGRKPDRAGHFLQRLGYMPSGHLYKRRLS